MKIVCRVDASQTIGSGHVMRCLTLANAMRERGAEVRFVCREHPGNLCDFIEEQGYPVSRLPMGSAQRDINNDALSCRHGMPAAPSCWDAVVGSATEIDAASALPTHAAWLGATWEEDSAQTREALTDWDAVDWIVVDHYGLDARWEREMRSIASRIMVIDDLADRKHDCDLLLDQNYYFGMETRYDGLVPDGCRKLLGPRYALLRPEFAEARKNLRQRDGFVRRILVFFGGMDPTNETTKAIRAIIGLNRPDIEVDVVVGAPNPHRDEIETLCGHYPNFHFHYQILNMAELMAQADLAVMAGGATTWERAVLGLPSVTLSIAKNQRRLCEDLAELGANIHLGESGDIDDEWLTNSLRVLCRQPHLLRAIGGRLKLLTDGKGVNRVAGAILGFSLTCRPATEGDCEWIFTWRNDARTRRFFFDNKAVDWLTHAKWFAEVLKDPSRELVIVEAQQTPIGVVRFDFGSDRTTAAVSIYLDPDRQGEGLGSGVIAAGCRYIRKKCVGLREIRAEVLSNNAPSLGAFLNAGFIDSYHILINSVLVEPIHK